MSKLPLVLAHCWRAWPHFSTLWFSLNALFTSLVLLATSPMPSTVPLDTIANFCIPLSIEESWVVLNEPQSIFVIIFWNESVAFEFRNAIIASSFLFNLVNALDCIARFCSWYFALVSANSFLRAITLSLNSFSYFIPASAISFADLIPKPVTSLNMLFLSPTVSFIWFSTLDFAELYLFAIELLLFLSFSLA